MTPRAASAPVASWTRKLDSEEKQEHDFSNLFSELGYAVRRQDGMMMRYCECGIEANVSREEGNNKATAIIECAAPTRPL